METLAKIIKKHRKKAGLTQKESADISGVGKTVVFDVEKGKEKVQFKTLLKLFKVLNIKMKIESRLLQNGNYINEKS